jgi:hypothetical protein
LTLDRVTTPLIKQLWDNLGKYNLGKSISHKTGRPLERRTLNGYMETFGAMFTVAAREYGWVQENPVKKITKKVLRNERVRSLDENELKRFMTAVKASSTHTFSSLSSLERETC